jgi:hypothetical protein
MVGKEGAEDGDNGIASPPLLGGNGGGEGLEFFEGRGVGYSIRHGRLQDSESNSIRARSVGFTGASRSLISAGKWIPEYTKRYGYGRFF